MPLARLSVDPSASVNTPLDILVPDGDPNVPAGTPEAFFGFALNEGVAGNRMSIITGRGSKVSPVVENGDPLTVNQPVYLSETPGEVTQTLTYGADLTQMRVGQTTSTTDMVLVTDARFVLGGS